MPGPPPPRPPPTRPPPPPMQPTPEPDLAADHAEYDNAAATEGETAGEADCEEELDPEEADDTEADPADNADGSDGEAEHAEELDPVEQPAKSMMSQTCRLGSNPGALAAARADLGAAGQSHIAGLSRVATKKRSAPAWQ